MVKNVIKYYCDICKKEKELNDLENITIPVYRTFDATDGMTRYDKKEYIEEKVDLCCECLEKIVKVWDKGVQCRELEIREE